jgi:hypothetical protein
MTHQQNRLGHLRSIVLEAVLLAPWDGWSINDIAVREFSAIVSGCRHTLQTHAPGIFRFKSCKHPKVCYDLSLREHNTPVLHEVSKCYVTVLTGADRL